MQTPLGNGKRRAERDYRTPSNSHIDAPTHNPQPDYFAKIGARRTAEQEGSWKSAEQLWGWTFLAAFVFGLLLFSWVRGMK